MTRAPRIVGNGWDALDGHEPDELPRVSVIVAHYDQPGELARTLRALATQDYPPERMEIVVADDGSPGEITVPDGVILVRQEDRGFRLAAVRNLGVRASSGAVLCFLDADTAPETGYVRALTRLPAMVPDAVTVGRRRHADLAGVGLDVPILEAVVGRELPEPTWLADHYARTRNLLDADDRSYRFVIGAVIACSRRLFDETGGFDESFTSYGGEDWEWAHRAWQAGAMLAHVPNAVAWHDGPDWAGRESAGLERANAQTLQLVTAIPVGGSAPRGLWPQTPDLIVRLRGAHTPPALFIAVDSLLAAFPQARIVLDAGSQPPSVDPRIVVGGPDPEARVVWVLDRPVVILDPAWIAERVTRLGSGVVGTIGLIAADGSSLGTVHSRRAMRRAARLGTDEGFETERAEPVGIHPLRADPRVEAWVGGWGGADQFC